MNVLYLTNNVQPAGTGRILMTWLGRSRAAGASPALVLPRAGALSRWAEAEGVPFAISRMPRLRKRWPIPAALELLNVGRWARARSIELVHCNEHDVYPFGVILARGLGVPIVCHVRFKIGRGFAAWAFGGWRAPDALLWTSNQQREDSREAIDGVVPEDRQWLVPLGPDLATFRPAGPNRASLRRRLDIGDHELAIGAATALRPIKRIHEFVDLVAELARRHPGVIGRIAGGAVSGDEAYRKRIEAQILATGLGRRLRWLGHLEPIDGFLKSLDAFVSTSEYETFGNSVCEAMACGVPVVAYTGGSVHEVVGDAGVIVPNGDLSGLIAAVERLIVDTGERKTLAERGVRRVLNAFNPDLSWNQLVEIHQGAVRRRSSAA